MPTSESAIAACRCLALLRHLPVLLLAMAGLAAAQGRDFMPASGAEVLERMAPRVPLRAPGPEAAASAAREAIRLARSSADPRHLGRAQALLGPWWDRPDAPVPVAVLQATVLQGRHEFAAAHRVLMQALARDDRHAQGWLTLATLERLAARYPQALQACAQVASAGAGLHAAACALETRSLLGEHDAARRGFQALRLQASDDATRGWLISLLAESEERAGRDEAALLAYRESLALSADGYTALVAADLLLRTGRPRAALDILVEQPDSDAVLLRRAYALRLLGDSRWRTMASELNARFAAIDARGDNPAAHARERALAHLWLDGDAGRAWSQARINLTLQKEPLDWWLALQSASQAGEGKALAALRDALRASGLRDNRLQAWQGNAGGAS